MTKLEAAAVKYAEKNHIWLKDAIPSLAAMKSFKDGAEWMHSETINKACEWLNENMEDYTEWFDVDEDYCQHHAVSSNYDYKKDFIRALRKAMEEQQ